MFYIFVDMIKPELLSLQLLQEMFVTPKKIITLFIGFLI